PPRQRLRGAGRELVGLCANPACGLRNPETQGAPLTGPERAPILQPVGRLHPYRKDASAQRPQRNNASLALAGGEVRSESPEWSRVRRLHLLREPQSDLEVPDRRIG